MHAKDAAPDEPVSHEIEGHISRWKSPQQAGERDAEGDEPAGSEAEAHGMKIRPAKPELPGDPNGSDTEGHHSRWNSPAHETEAEDQRGVDPSEAIKCP